MEFRIVRGELPKLQPVAIEEAIMYFIIDTDLKGDTEGFLQQTMTSIQSSVFRGTGDFWMAVDEIGLVKAYALSHVTIDIDNKLTYWISQAWVDKSLYGKKEVKQWWQQIRAQAKQNGCKHIVVVSGRGTEAYCRWLGKGWHEYARLLKEDI